MARRIKVHKCFDMNKTLDLLNCHTVTDPDWDLIHKCRFWVGGIAACCIGIPGLILNLLAICILATGVSKTNNFNRLTTSLFVFDTLFLVLSLGNVVNKSFGLVTRTYTILLPKFLFPVRYCSMSASIFMTVGIAHERYIAIKYPIHHHQAMESAKFRRIHLMKYILSTVVCAIVFNIPKFFELELAWTTFASTATNHTTER